MSKKKNGGGSNKGNQDNIKPLMVPPVKSTPQVMMCLREAITHARHHRITGIMIVMVPENPENDYWMKAATPLTPTDVDLLLEAVEEGHEVVYQMGRGHRFD